MKAEDIGTMLAQMVMGVSKERCDFVVDEETSAIWDSMSKEIAEVEAKAETEGKTVIFDAPTE